MLAEKKAGLKLGLNWVCFFGEVKVRYIILEHRENLIGNQNSRL